MAGNGMPFAPAATIPKSRSFSNPATRHQVRRPDTLQFSTLEGTCRMAGVPEHRLRRLIAKEVTDNALDECDRAGSPGMALIEQRDLDRYVVTDVGRGIDGDAETLAELFSANRPMVSGKYWRTISRGVLGNGLRVLCAAVALCGGTITVETRGRRTVLRPERFGVTHVVGQGLSDISVGTRIIYTLDGTVPYTPGDLADAEAAIKVAQSALSPYARRSSPHWHDLDKLAETFAAIEPPDTTVRQLIEQLDGCTGAVAGRLAAQFGKGRTCRSMTEPEVAELLAALHDAARVVKARHLGPIGADAFGDVFDAYISSEAGLRIGGREPRAVCPVLIEAWASVTSRKGGDASLRIFCNRTPVVGTTAARRGYGNRIVLAGAGLEGVTFEAAGGDCDLILAVTSPFIPQTSLGKAADLHVIRKPITEALHRAFVRSRNRLPTEPQAPKPPKHQLLPKPARPPPYEPSGVLAKWLAAEAETEGVKPADLLVLSRERDPFSESKAIRRNAEWFAEQFARFVPTGKLHPRGVYYRILASGDVLLPDGSRFFGTEETARLIEEAGKYARHLGLVRPFDRIIDERAAPPMFFNTEGERSDPLAVQTRTLIVDDGSRAFVPGVAAMLPTISASVAIIPRQPFRLCLIGEKTSLGDVLRPVARDVQAELLLLTGEISEAFAFGICVRAADDGRPLRIFYFSDFDPSGWQMLVSLARKIQAHIVREYPDLDVRLFRNALNVEQVRRFNLPDSPIKAGDKRAARWRERWSCEQVEIDALAALRPELLDQIARASVAPYYDTTLQRRFDAANKLPPELTKWLPALPAYRDAQRTIRAAHRRADKAATSLNAQARQHAETVRMAIAAGGGPVLPPVAIKPELPPEPETDTVFDSRDTFLAATRKLQRIKHDYHVGDGESDD
jgi:hypothetical protein